MEDILNLSKQVEEQICWCSKSHTYYGSTWTFPRAFDNAFTAGSVSDNRSNNAGGGTGFIYIMLVHQRFTYTSNYDY